jgi:membrane-associated protease RseP (regulator of RpoE activity)
MMCNASMAETSQSDLLRKPVGAGPNALPERGWLGLTVQDLTPELVQALGLEEMHGVLIASVEPDGPAAQGGIDRGDTIVSVNGRLVPNKSTLVSMLAEVEPGTMVQVEILRAGTRRTLQVMLEHPPIAPSRTMAHLSPEEVEALLGIAVQQEQRGVVLTHVNPDGPAAQAGLKSGDSIHEINRTAVTTLESYHTALASWGLEKPALILIERQGKPFYVAVKPKKTGQNVATVSSPHITEDEVRNILKALDDAVGKKDLDAVKRHFSPEASIEMTLITPLGNQTVRFTREELLNYFNQGYNLATVTSRQLYFRMDMSLDGQQATVMSASEATATLMGLRMPFKIEEATHFARLQNTLVITGITATAQMESLGGLDWLRFLR